MIWLKSKDKKYWLKTFEGLKVDKNIKGTKKKS